MKPYAVIDCETNPEAIKGELNDLWCVGVFKPEEEWTGIFHGDVSLYKEELQEILNTHIAIFHNSTFDIWVLESFGFRVHDYEDTMIMSYNVFPAGSHSLAAWGERFNFPKIDHQDFTGYSAEMATYCSHDCYITWKIFKELDGKVPPIYPVDRDFVRIIIDMQNNGLGIDADKLEGVMEGISQELIPIKDKIKEIAPVALSSPYKRKTMPDFTTGYQNYEQIKQLGVGAILYEGTDDEGNHLLRKVVDFNPSSSDQLAFVLSSLYGWEPKEFTPSGKPKTDKEVLKELPYELAEYLLLHSKYTKLISTYGNSMLKYVKDGRIHTNYNNCVTRTGRLSSSSPNLQNIPSTGEVGDTIRSLFVPKKGYKLVCLDIDQFQLRILAWYLAYYGFSDYLYIYFCTNEDADPHSLTASLLFGENFTKDQRKLAKTLNFAVIFGISAMSIARKFGINVKEAEEKLNLLEDFYGIDKLREFIIEGAKANEGYVYTAFGRQGYYPDIFSKSKAAVAHAERQIFNFIIQGTESDLVKIMMLTIDGRTIYKIYTVLQVHDEFGFEAPEDTAQPFADECTACIVWNDWLPINENAPVPIPLFGKANVGDSWYETK